MGANDHKVTNPITVIQSLPDRVVGAASALKTAFDNVGEIVRLKHNALCDYVDTDIATKADLISITQGAVADGSVTNAKLATDVRVGSLAALTTTEKGSAVGAINEVDGRVDTVDAKIPLIEQGTFAIPEGSGNSIGTTTVVIPIEADYIMFSALNAYTSVTGIAIPGDSAKRFGNESVSSDYRAVFATVTVGTGETTFTLKNNTDSSSVAKTVRYVAVKY